MRKFRVTVSIDVEAEDEDHAARYAGYVAAVGSVMGARGDWAADDPYRPPNPRVVKAEVGGFIGMAQVLDSGEVVSKGWAAPTDVSFLTHVPGHDAEEVFRACTNDECRDYGLFPHTHDKEPVNAS